MKRTGRFNVRSGLVGGGILVVLLLRPNDLVLETLAITRERGVGRDVDRDRHRSVERACLLGLIKNMMVS